MVANPFTMDENRESAVPSKLLQEVRIMLRHSRDRSLDTCVLRLDLRNLSSSDVEKMEDLKNHRGREWRRKRQKEKADLKTIKQKKKESERPSVDRPWPKRPMAHR